MDNKGATELSLKIKDLFLSASKNSNATEKWSYLEDYRTRYLNCDEISPILLSNYIFVATTLLDSLQPTSFANKHQEKIFDDIFLHAVHHEAFKLLVRKLHTSSPSYQQQKILNLLKQFLKQNMHLMLLRQCLSSGKWDPTYISACQMWNELLMFIVSLPDRIANKTKGKMSKIFRAEFYIPLLVSSILKTLTLLHEEIRESRNCTLEFIGKLVGKLCVLGHGDVVSKNLIIAIIKHSESDYIWRRMCQNLISKVPMGSIEQVMTHILLECPWYGYIEWILGNLGMTNAQLKFILTTKLLLHRHFKNVLVLQNIIGYYASSDSRRSCFWSIFRSLIKLWADESAIKYQSSEQQKCIASALVVCTSWLKEDVSECKAFVEQALQGTSIRIGNSEEFVRSLGMIVGGILVSALNPEAPPLELKNVANAELSDLLDLKIIPSNPGLDSLCYTEHVNCFKEKTAKDEKNASVTMETESAASNVKIDMDSDDDLEPYDLSNDVPQAQAKPPLYLRDCLKGLIECEKPDMLEQCLQSAERLIEANANSVHEVAMEMAKVLLHLEDKFSIPGFCSLRIKILVSLTVHCPIMIAEYLASQFHEDDYNIQQRLDILQVLALSSHQLCKPKEVQVNSQTNAENSYKCIVQERIAAKTRYFTKTPQKAKAEMMANQFSDVAGHFFFPLLAKFKRENKRLQLFGKDSYVLGRLIYCLGMIMNAAINIPMCEKMGGCLLEFIAIVRYNPDVYIRQASIFATAAVFSSVPGYLLFSELATQVIDSQEWLQSVILEDCDANCQIQALSAVALILKIMTEEMPDISQLIL